MRIPGVTFALTIALTATAAGAQGIVVGTAAPAAGHTAYGVLAVPAGVDSGYDIPVAVIRGAQPGRVVAFVAGSHGTEYASVIALQRLIARIDPATLHGTVIVAPLVNVASFERMTPHLDPVDGKSMNGNYPGNAGGTQTERALDAITRAIVDPADVIVDLHGGDLDEDLRPYSYWFRGGRPAQDSAGLTLARAFGLDHIIVEDVDLAAPATGRTLSGQSMVRGKQVVVAEAGRTGTTTDADVNALIDGSLNVLGSLGMIARSVHPSTHMVWLDGTHSARVTADSAGVFIPLVARDARVTAGQLIGYTTDFLGRRTGDVHAPIAGLVTFIRGVPSMWPRATLVNVSPVMQTPGEWARPQ
ncbi:MAG TPA: succinylglutamate desuccinylase/aspartoacylase family protein [Gemmatimonadaceae bacterium]|nr:succinylglutamate desuccinylase/aspartoacylase family protein [Gemmatimonadaceae bacterium]